MGNCHPPNNEGFVSCAVYVYVPFGDEGRAFPCCLSVIAN